MKKLLILICLPLVVFPSFPVLNGSDPDEIGGVISAVLGLIGFILGVYYLYRLYTNSSNPWLRFLGIFRLIVMSIFMLFSIILRIDGV